MRVKYLLLLALLLSFFFKGCSAETDKTIDTKKITAPINKNIKWVNQTTLIIEGSNRATISEFCINGELVVFIDSYNSGGSVKMNDSSKCEKR